MLNTKDQKIISINKTKNENRYDFALNIFSFIPLALIVFGILALGMFVAPVVFKQVVPREMAAETMTIIFLRFYKVAFSCILVTITAEALRFAFFRQKLLKTKIWLVQFFTIFIIGLGITYSNFYLNPAINQMRLANIQNVSLWVNEEFSSLHKRSEALAKLTFALGLIPLIIMLRSKKS